jgi:hypothetical protein
LLNTAKPGCLLALGATLSSLARRDGATHVGIRSFTPTETDMLHLLLAEHWYPTAL